MLQVGQLLGICHCLEQRAVPLLALAHRVDLRLDARYLGVQILQRNSQSTQPVVRGDLVGFDSLTVAALGQMAGTVGELGQLSIQLGNFEQRALLRDCSFHGYFSPPWLSTFHGSVRMGHTRTDSAAPKRRPQNTGSLFTPRIFTGPVRDVDQRDIGSTAMLVGRMVAQIGRHIDLDIGRRRSAQQRVARASAHRDPRHQHVRVARGAHSPRRFGIRSHGRRRFRFGRADPPSRLGGQAPARHVERRLLIRVRCASPPAPAAPRGATPRPGPRPRVPGADAADRRWAPSRAGTGRCRRSNCSASSRRSGRSGREDRLAPTQRLGGRDHPLVQIGRPPAPDRLDGQPQRVASASDTPGASRHWCAR